MMKTLCVLVLLLVFVPTVVLGQTGGEQVQGSGAAQSITAGTAVTVHLQGTTPVELSYDSDGDETVSISVRSLEPDGALDPTLTVLDSSGASIAFNDDHRTSRTDLALRDSLVADLSLTSAGIYTLQVASFSDVAGGDVEVLLTTDGASGEGEVPRDIAPAPAPAEQTISDRVPDNDSYTHDFQASEGEVLTITVRSTDNQLDPKLSLQDDSGRELASNDDHGSGDSSLGPYDSRIANFVVPETGNYVIEITGFAGIGGTFDLTINRGSEPIEVPTPDIQATPASSDNTQVVEGSINVNDSYRYTLAAQAGEVYTITVQATTGDFDPRVNVYLDDNYIADNDDYGSTDSNLQSTDARIYNLITTETAAYEVIVRGYQESAGSFRLTIERVATDAPAGLPTEQVQLGTLNSGEVFSFEFEAQAGDYVTISARALTTDFDPYITLLDASGSVLFDNDDHSTSAAIMGFTDAQIPNYHITQSGTYTVEVTAVGGVGGSFGLTVGILR